MTLIRLYCMWKDFITQSASHNTPRVCKVHVIAKQNTTMMSLNTLRRLPTWSQIWHRSFVSCKNGAPWNQWNLSRKKKTTAVKQTASFKPEWLRCTWLVFFKFKDAFQNEFMMSTVIVHASCNSRLTVCLSIWFWETDAAEVNVELI